MWINANLATMTEQGMLQNAALAIINDEIAWVGKTTDISQATLQKLTCPIYDCKNAWITPGLIDCHTHLVYAGNRENEFNLRLQGKTYVEIAAMGGGIKATVNATRQASFEELLAQSTPRLKALLAEGVTTVEIKSGYGLDLATEKKMLQVAEKLSKQFPVTIQKTFLGAHALPNEYKNNADDYVQFIIDNMLPQLHAEGLIDAIDGFCEKIAFTREQITKLFKRAKALNIPLKLHAEQLSDQGGAAMAANMQALSCDHLEYITEAAIEVMAANNTVAVLLPGAYYFLQETRKPPIDLLRQYKVPIAIATDCNPGSSPTCSLLLMMNMACVLWGLTPSEALAAVTINAAKALGYHDHLGSIQVGSKADFVIWDVNSPTELAYFFGRNPIQSIVKNGIKRPVDHE